MSILSNIPQISVLRQRVEARFGKALAVHNDFIALVDDIELTQRQHISESTLERVWNYSTRGYATVSLRTLDVLAMYAEGCDWRRFCQLLVAKSDVESVTFSVECLYSADLNLGDKLSIAWLPDRVCHLSYLGDNRFVAEACENATIKQGYSFLCSQFMLGMPLVLSELRDQDGQLIAKTYIVGQKNGLTSLWR